MRTAWRLSQSDAHTGCPDGLPRLPRRRSSSSFRSLTAHWLTMSCRSHRLSSGRARIPSS
eukprot:1687971-Alexandrium_andersonii.AAC.1